MVGPLIGFLAMILSFSLGRLLIEIEHAPLEERPVMAYSSQGRNFLLVLGLSNLAVYFGLWVFLGLSWWPLAIIAPIGAALGNLFVRPSILLILIVAPLYALFCRLTTRWYSD